MPCARKKMLHVPNAWNPAAQYCQWVTDYLSIIAYGSDLGSGKKHSIMYSKTFFSGTQLLNSPTVQILRLRCP